MITGLALVAVVGAACARGGDDGAVDTGSSPLPTPSMTASAEVTNRSPEPTATTSASSDRTGGTRSSKADRRDGLDGPYRLRIPRIGVNARVVSIQSDAQRVLNPPEDPSLAGWWSDGAAPGAARGSAVLVGHTVRDGGRGVFDSVGNLERGDAIVVRGSDSALTYRVKSVQVLGKEEVARQAEEIFDQTGAGRLVIITCDDWDGAAWQSNIVTVAAPA